MGSATKAAAAPPQGRIKAENGRFYICSYVIKLILLKIDMVSPNNIKIVFYGGPSAVGGVVAVEIKKKQF